MTPQEIAEKVKQFDHYFGQGMKLYRNWVENSPQQTVFRNEDFDQYMELAQNVFAEVQDAVGREEAKRLMPEA